MLDAFFSSINSSGGHIIIGLVMLCVGAIMAKSGIPKGEDLIVAGTTLIGRAMMDQPRKDNSDAAK